MSVFDIWEAERRVDRIDFPNDTIAEDDTQQVLLRAMEQTMAQFGINQYMYHFRKLGSEQDQQLRIRISMLVENDRIT